MAEPPVLSVKDTVFRNIAEGHIVRTLSNAETLAVDIVHRPSTPRHFMEKKDPERNLFNLAKKKHNESKGDSKADIATQPPDEDITCFENISNSFMDVRVASGLFIFVVFVIFCVVAVGVFYTNGRNDVVELANVYAFNTVHMIASSMNSIFLNRIPLIAHSLTSVLRSTTPTTTPSEALVFAVNRSFSSLGLSLESVTILYATGSYVAVHTAGDGSFWSEMFTIPAKSNQSSSNTVYFDAYDKNGIKMQSKLAPLNWNVSKSDAFLLALDLLGEEPVYYSMTDDKWYFVNRVNAGTSATNNLMAAIVIAIDVSSTNRALFQNAVMKQVVTKSNDQAYVLHSGYLVASTAPNFPTPTLLSYNLEQTDMVRSAIRFHNAGVQGFVFPTTCTWYSVTTCAVAYSFGNDNLQMNFIVVLLTQVGVELEVAFTVVVSTGAAIGVLCVIIVVLYQHKTWKSITDSIIPAMKSVVLCHVKEAVVIPNSSVPNVYEVQRSVAEAIHALECYHKFLPHYTPYIVQRNAFTSNAFNLATPTLKHTRCTALAAVFNLLGSTSLQDLCKSHTQTLRCCVEICSTACHRTQGFVLGVTGDHLMSIFGLHSHAHAESACRTANAIRGALDASTMMTCLSLGIHTTEGCVGVLGRESNLSVSALGPMCVGATHCARHAQSFGIGVLLSEATYQSTSFDFKQICCRVASRIWPDLDDQTPVHLYAMKEYTDDTIFVSQISHVASTGDVSIVNSWTTQQKSDPVVHIVLKELQSPRMGKPLFHSPPTPPVNTNHHNHHNTTNNHNDPRDDHATPDRVQIKID